ncbi:extracellular matrix protein 2 [Mantella aurantiaca]
MKTYYLMCLFVLISICNTWAEDENSTPPKRQRKKNLSRRRVYLKSSSRRQQLIQPSPIPVPKMNVPLYNEDDALIHILQAVLGVQEQAPNNNLLPVKKGHCIVNGMVMYNKTVWSPKPCVTCICSNGKEICDEIICPSLRCLRTVTEEGECCPVCNDIGHFPIKEPNSMSMDSKIELSGDSQELTEPSNAVLMTTLLGQEKISKFERKKEENSKKNESIKKKEQKINKKEGKRLVKKIKEITLEEEEEEMQKEIRKAYEEEEFRSDSNKKLKREEALKEKEKRRKKEGEGRRDEEVIHLTRECKQKTKECHLKEDEEENEEEDENEDNEEHTLGADVFRVPKRRIPGSHRPENDYYSPLPPGCFISEITVSCSNAKLTGIPPLSNQDVKSLDLQGNLITTVPKDAFNGMPNLEMIDLSKNKLTTTGIDLHAFKPLKSLKRLYLDGNLLDQIPPELPSTLEELKINENKLGSLELDSLKDLKNLVTLELEGNQLSEANVSPLAFKPLQRVTYMRLGRNKFRTMPQGLPASVEELYLENNEIEEILETSLNHTVNLNIVVLRHNKLEETTIAPLTWILHTNLESIDLSYNKFFQVPSYLPQSLLHLVLVGNQIERIPGYVFAHLNPGLEYLYLSYNKLSNDGIDPISFHGAYHSLREIFLDHNELTRVPFGVEDMKDLHILRLNNNKIKTVSPNCICNLEDDRDSKIKYLHLENNYINTREISPYSFSCIRSFSNVILKPQKV